LANSDTEQKVKRTTRMLAMSVDALPARGGISVFSHHLCNEFSDLCEQVVFIGPAGTCIPAEHTANYKIIEDIHSKTTKRFGPAYEGEKARIQALIGKTIERYEINRLVVFHPFYYGSAAVQAASSTGLPCHVFVHGTELTSQFPEAYVGSDLSETPWNSLRFELLYTLTNATNVIANSRRTKEIAHTIAPRASLAVCGCGIPERLINDLSERRMRLAQKRAARLARHGSDAPEVCYIGRLVKHKRVDRILTFLSQNNWRLSIIGDGPARQELEAEVTERNICDRVSFLGAVNDADKWDVLRSSDFLVLPSRYSQETGGYEGFGIVLLEAAAAGTIPITSGEDGTADPLELYGIGVKGFCDAESTEILQCRLDDFISSEESYSKKVEQDLNTLRTALNWRQIAINLLSGAIQHV